MRPVLSRFVFARFVATRFVVNRPVAMRIVRNNLRQRCSVKQNTHDEAQDPVS